MAHIHEVYDTDVHFFINTITRKIVNTSEQNQMIQYDHNSERFSFEIARYIDGHDMMLCDKVEIHYVNTDKVSKEENRGIYAVVDLQVSPEDNEMVIFSWLLSRNATEFVGNLQFQIKFACMTAETVDYLWSTDICTDFSVVKSICNTEYIVEQYADALENKVNVKQGTAHAGKLLYIDNSGNVSKLTLGNEFEIKDGVLQFATTATLGTAKLGMMIL